MHSGGLELTRLTYSRHEDNLLHHRGDRSVFYVSESKSRHTITCYTFFDFDFDLDIVRFILSFSSAGYYSRTMLFSLVSVSVATRLAYDTYIDTVRTYADITFLFFLSEVYQVPGKICFSYCVYYPLFLFVFLMWGNLPLQSYWSLSCGHGLHCSDELMWDKQQQQRVHNK